VLTGAPPFRGGTAADVARRRLTEAPPVDLHLESMRAAW